MLFLMVTAETSKEMVMGGAREYQPDGYLTKPINRAMLEQRLGSLIKQRNALLPPITREIDGKTTRKPSVFACKRCPNSRATKPG